MKMSKRELLMVIVLLVIALVGGSYYLLLQPQSNTKEELLIQQEELDSQVKTVEAQVASIPRVRESAEAMVKQIKEDTASYLPEIRAEKIILMLDDLFVQNGIVVRSSSFTPPGPAQGSIPSAPQPSNPGTYLTLDQIAAKLQELEGGPTEPTPIPEPPAPIDPGAIQSGLASVTVLGTSIDFEAPYESMAAFITGLEELQRSLAVKNLMISQTEFGTVTGSIAVDFFALPKIYDTSDDPYLEWPYEGEYGKLNPFAAPGYDLTFNVGAYVTDPTNLAVSIPALSEQALLQASSAEIVAVDLEITPAVNGFGCVIRIGDAVYPAAGSAAVLSDGPMIRVLVTSTQRVGEADQAGITLNVSNTSDRPVMVTVVGEDAVRPRIAVGTLTGNVSVR